MCTRIYTFLKNVYFKSPLKSSYGHRMLQVHVVNCLQWKSYMKPTTSTLFVLCRSLNLQYHFNTIFEPYVQSATTARDDKTRSTRLIIKHKRQGLKLKSSHYIDVSTFLTFTIKGRTMLYCIQIFTNTFEVTVQVKRDIGKTIT